VSPRGTLLPHTAAAASSGRRWYGGGVTTVETPEMGESITEGTYAATLKSPGDAVAVDDVVLQIETDKVTLDVRSPYNGALVEFLVEEGDTVTVGMPLFTIDQSAGACLYLCVRERKRERPYKEKEENMCVHCTLLPLRH
jgi:pyruvate/2-oxoglutarate dehydrogenase complex dihydrolipoamide acyltransferase (E2) component